MRVHIAIILLIGLLGLASCSSSKPVPHCPKRPDLNKLTVPERIALEDSLARFGGRCNRQETTCEISVTHNKKGQILLSVASVYTHQESGQCLQAPGEMDLAVYSQVGTFIAQSLLCRPNKSFKPTLLRGSSRVHTLR